MDILDSKTHPIKT